MLARQSVTCGVVLAGATLVLAALSASAQDQKDKAKPALSGQWVQQGGELKIEFCDKEVLKISPHGDDAAFLLICSYTLAKDKRIQAKITELTGTKSEKAKEIVPVGLEFNFKWEVKDGVATLDDVQGKNVDLIKTHLEGKFDKK
jgi:hypothetical protein